MRGLDDRAPMCRPGSLLRPSAFRMARHDLVWDLGTVFRVSGVSPTISESGHTFWAERAPAPHPNRKIGKSSPDQMSFCYV
jgi:hypothetical protein